MLDAGVSYISNQGGKSNWQMVDDIAVPNIFGVHGAEDLGGGLKAKFRLVNQFSLANGSIIPVPGNSSTTSGAPFSLSKRTLVYARTAYQIANAGATAAICGTFGPSSNNHQFVGRIGIETKF